MRKVHLMVYWGAFDLLSAPVDSMGLKWERLTGLVARCGARPLMTE